MNKLFFLNLGSVEERFAVTILAWSLLVHLIYTCLFKESIRWYLCSNKCTGSINNKIRSLFMAEILYSVQINVVLKPKASHYVQNLKFNV